MCVVFSGSLEQALRIRRGEPYRVVYPFFRGGLNVSPTYPIQELLAHLAKVCTERARTFIHSNNV